jgi:hypothetical protein
VPCTVTHGTGRARVHLHGNAGCGLGALGGIVASEVHGHCTVQGGSEVAASWEIDRVRVGEVGSEETGMEVVGAAFPKLGVHDGHGNILRRRRGSAGGHCGVGSCEVVGRMA